MLATRGILTKVAVAMLVIAAALPMPFSFAAEGKIGLLLKPPKFRDSDRCVEPALAPGAQDKWLTWDGKQPPDATLEQLRVVGKQLSG